MSYENLLNRFLTYVKINTRSNPDSTTTPSTQTQVDFALNVLKPEMESVGLQDVHYLTNGYLVGTLPANDSTKTRKIGFIAHMDTADFNAEGISHKLSKIMLVDLLNLVNLAMRFHQKSFQI